MENGCQIRENSDIKIIYADSNYQNILEFPLEEIIYLFKSFGLILFRNFGINHEQMKKITKKMSSQVVVYPTKSNVDSYDDWLIQIADEGTHPIAAHRENGSTPFVSDVLWLCCDVAATEGGETLFWNGVRVWEQLSDQIKQLFTSKKIDINRKIFTIQTNL